jgi:hypothetical protein
VFDQILGELNQFKEMVSQLLSKPKTKDWYTPAEAAELLDRAEWTVREWCRNQRVHAKKRSGGRGKALEWIISHDELVRIQNHGLLPLPKYRFER